MGTFVQKLEQRHGQNIYLVTGGQDQTGMPAWHYVQVVPHRRSMFERKISSGEVSLTEYGAIIESGYGTKPPQEIIDFMSRTYGFEN